MSYKRGITDRLMMDNNHYGIRRLEKVDAEEILQWRYERPYDFYNPPEDNKDRFFVNRFLDPELMFHAVVDPSGNFIGFCSYGIDGQIFGGNYLERALDIGLGMKPELTGQGRGAAFVGTIFEYGKSLSPEMLRLTVATFNSRAMSLYRRFGFEEIEQFIDAFYDVPYTVMIQKR